MGTPRYACLKCDKLLPIGAEKCPFCGEKATHSSQANIRGIALAAEGILDDDDVWYAKPKQKKKKKGVGLFGLLIAGVAAAGNAGSHKKHNGRCDGDCANCPPHYGYRYGHWYFPKADTLHYPSS